MVGAADEQWAKVSTDERIVKMIGLARGGTISPEQLAKLIYGMGWINGVSFGYESAMTAVRNMRAAHE